MDTTVRIEDLLNHRAWVSALARSLVRDEATAHDLEQDAWATAIASPPAHGRSPKGWLATVLRNRLRDRRRVEARRARREESVARRGTAPSAAELAATADAHRRVMDAVVSLEEPYRETVLLRYYEGLTPAVIAERTRVPASTVRTRLARAHDRLRAALDERHGGDGRAWTLALVPLLTDRPAALGGLGGFLMAHKVKLVAATLLALVGVSVLVSTGAPAADPAPRSQPDPVTAAIVEEPVVPGEEPAGSEERKKVVFRLAETIRSDASAVPIEDTVAIEISADGKMKLDIEGSEPAVRRLMWFAEEKRDLGHPMQPSKQGVLFRVDARAPWRAVAAALELPDDPDVRIHRLYFAARHGKTKVGLAAFAAKDSLLARTKSRVFGRLRRHVVLTRGTSTSIRYQGRELGEGEAAFAALTEFLPARDEAVRKHAVLLHVDGDVPFQDVLRVVELLPKVYAEHFADRRHLHVAGLLRTDGHPVPQGSVEELEARFVPKAEDREHVRELLKQMEMGDRTVAELRKKVSPSSSLALGLGIAYTNRGGEDDFLRAVVLSRLVAEAAPPARYSARWWEAERLLIRAMLGYARAKQDRPSFEMTREMVAAYTNLGLLEGSPVRGEILRLAGEIEAELEKLAEAE